MSTRDVASAYDARAEEYAEKLGALDQMAPEDRAGIQVWAAAHPGRLLDAGCGPGHWSDALAAQRPGGVIAVDSSQRFIDQGRVRFPRVTFARADLAHLPFADGSFEAVLAWFSLIHATPSELPHLVNELSRVVSAGGSILIGYFDGEPGADFEHAVTTAYYGSADVMTALLAEHDLKVDDIAVRRSPGTRALGTLSATRIRAGGLEGGPTLGA